MAEKKLYIVTVEFQYAAVAESEEKACAHADQEADMIGRLRECARAAEARRGRLLNGSHDVCLPDGWEGDSQVHGEDITFDDAVAKYVPAAPAKVEADR